MTKIKSTKRALLTSGLALLLCLSMFVGTTFAWFTDSVASTNNIIKSGNLDVELYWSTDASNWEKVDKDTNVFTKDLWEPGHTEVVYLKVVNEGTLALKYNLGVNIESETPGTNVAGETFYLSDYIKYGVVETGTAFADRAAARDAVKTDAVGLKNSYVKVSSLVPATDVDASANLVAEEYVAMVVYMPEETGNEANYRGTVVPTINLGINLFATQYTYEDDSFDNRYDGEAFIPVADVDALGAQTVPLTTAAGFGSNLGTSLDLDASFSFKTTEDDVAAAAGGYRYWHADFVVSADKDIAANSVALAGYYDAFAQATGTVGQWIALVPDTDVSAGTEIRLLELMGVTGNYEELCDWIPEFLCGVADLATDGSNAGTTLTVELRLYETTIYSGATSGSANIETGEYKTIGTYTHTFGGVKVSTADELAAALTSGAKNINVVLANDIDLPITSLGAQTPGSGEYKIGGTDTQNITIDLNGNELNITTTYMSAIGANNADATITIKNGSMNSTGNSATTWNINDLIFANCNYVIENVVFDKEVALENTGKTATFRNVTINGTGDYYALWISACGQGVDINGLTINTNGRGIKIDEQYVSTPSKVTLSVSNATFDTANKAAIMVKSAAGADIALNNVDIIGVDADPFNAVWVDEDAAAYAALVTVTGGTKVIEGAIKTSSVATGTKATLSSVITSGGQNIIDNNGTLDLSNAVGVGGADIVVNGGVVDYGTTGGFTKGIQSSGTVIYNDATIVGSMCLYGDKVVFNNCTFDLTNISDYVWTYGAKVVEFNNCTFNTKGKAILVYNEGTVGSSEVTVNGCTFNATGSAYASAVPGQPCAAVEIDSSLIPGNYTLNFVGENVVDSDFSGLVRIKSDGGKNNVVINGATAVVLP